MAPKYATFNRELSFDDVSGFGPIVERDEDEDQDETEVDYGPVNRF